MRVCLLSGSRPRHTFAPYKLAISGLHKKLSFAVVGQHGGKPIVLDDTCAFLPCGSAEEAGLIQELLTSEDARTFYESQIFWDAKRPVTTELLNRLDLVRLADGLGSERPAQTRWNRDVVSRRAGQALLFGGSE